MKTHLFLFAFAACTALAGNQKPNILFILADDLGYGDLSCYGSRDIQTPNLDRLAADGARFTSWYAQPYCTPSRYSLLTGQHPNRAPQLMNALNRAEDIDHNKGLPRDAVTVAELLQPVGYRSTILGKWHLGHGQSEFFPTHHGFERFFGHTGGCVDMFTLRYGNIPDWYEGETLVEPAGYATDVVSDAAISFLRQQTHQTPFFLYVALDAPHYGKGWDPVNKKLLNVLQAKPETIARLTSIPDHDRRVYAAMVVEADEAIGKILATLKSKGFAENTWVIFASDNGADVDFGGNNSPLRGEKGTLWEGGIRVPCIMKWPGHFAPGTKIDQPSMVVDFVPTLCKIAGVSLAGKTLDGIDLGAALFSGHEIEREIYHQRNADGSLRNGHWKYLRTEGKDQLFDLENDLGERHNLADQYPEVLRKMKARQLEIGTPWNVSP